MWCLSLNRLRKFFAAAVLVVFAGCYADLNQVRRDALPAWYYSISRAGKILASGAVEAGGADEVLRVEPPAGAVWRASVKLQGFGVSKEVVLSFPSEGGVWRIYGLEIVIRPYHVLRPHAPQVPQVPASAILVKEAPIPAEFAAASESEFKEETPSAIPERQIQPAPEVRASEPERFESRERKLLAWVEERKKAEEEEKRRLEEVRKMEQKLKELQQAKAQAAVQPKPQTKKTPFDLLEEAFKGQKDGLELVRKFLVPIPVYMGQELAVFIEELYRSKDTPRLYVVSLKVKNRTSKAVAFDPKMLKFPGMAGTKGNCSGVLAPGQQCSLYAAMVKEGA